jgi:hypothetical protein
MPNRHRNRNRHLPKKPPLDDNQGASLNEPSHNKGEECQPIASPPIIASFPKRLEHAFLTWLRANFFTWLFRLFTFISVSYLVYDRIYETGALTQSPASDPHDPFLFPFSITNMSHIFTLRDIKWRCEFPFRTYDRLNPINGSPANIYEDMGNVSGRLKNCLRVTCLTFLADIL